MRRLMKMPEADLRWLEPVQHGRIDVDVPAPVDGKGRQVPSVSPTLDDHRTQRQYRACQVRSDPGGPKPAGRERLTLLRGEILDALVPDLRPAHIRPAARKTGANSNTVAGSRAPDGRRRASVLA